ncbi:MAG: hypothetical protein AB7H77_12755 [Bdellovibrionales bacterium]
MARDQKKLDEWDKKFAAAQTEQQKIAIVEEIRAYVREQARLSTPESRKKLVQELDAILDESHRFLDEKGLSENEREAILAEMMRDDGE